VVSPSATVSSAPVTVIHWGVAQLALVKISGGRNTTPSLVLLLAKGMVTVSAGAAIR
jgi:hypothetical protein